MLMSLVRLRQMNLVTGLWGMNVNVPGQDASGLGWFFGVSRSHVYATRLPSLIHGRRVQILGCLAAFAVVGAFLTYRVRESPVVSASPAWH